jgi:hypothetical protein
VEPAAAPIVAVPKEAVISGAHNNANNEYVAQIQPLSNATNMLTESEASGLDASPVSASAPPATPMPAYRPAITNSEQIASPEDTIMTEIGSATATPELAATPQDISMTENTPTAQPSASEPLVSSRRISTRRQSLTSFTGRSVFLAFHSKLLKIF